MILFKSAIREAVLSGRLTIEDDNGNPFPGWGFDWSSSGAFGTESSLAFTEGDPVGLQPASIDLHLGDHWLVSKPNAKVQGRVANGSYSDGELSFPTYDFLDTAKPIEYTEYKSEVYMIPAHGFVLVRTQEVIGLDNSLIGFVDGRSSFGRAGLFAETAGLIDPGFKGSITLEIVNALPYPVKLYSGTRCCQVTLFEGVGSVEGGYQGSYQGQLGTKGSMLYKTVPGGAR